MHIFLGFCIYFSLHYTPTLVAKYGKEETELRLGAGNIFTAVSCQLSSTLWLIKIQTLTAGAYFNAKWLAWLKLEFTVSQCAVLAHLVSALLLCDSFKVKLHFNEGIFMEALWTCTGECMVWCAKCLIKIRSKKTWKALLIYCPKIVNYSSAKQSGKSYCSSKGRTVPTPRQKKEEEIFVNSIQ